MFRRRGPIVDVEQLPPYVLHQIQRGLDLDNKWQNFASEIGLTAQDIHQYEYKARNSDRGPSWHMFQNWYAKCPTILNLVAVLIKLGRDNDLTKLRDCIHSDDIKNKINDYLEQRHQEDHEHFSSLLPEHETIQSGSIFVTPQEPSRPSMTNSSSTGLPSIPINPTAPAWNSQQSNPTSFHNHKTVESSENFSPANVAIPGRAIPSELSRQYSNAPTLIPPGNNNLSSQNMPSNPTFSSNLPPSVNGTPSSNNQRSSRFAKLRELLDMGSCHFTRQEIEIALTNRGDAVSFNGRLGTVRRVFLRKSYMAVKTLENVKDTNSRSEQIMNEVQALVKFRHPNIISLIGYCYQKVNNQLNLYLIYPWMWHGNLWEKLYLQTANPMTAIQRLECLVAVARALFFLHSNCPKPAYHGNIRSENVVFDERFVPYLCGFSFCRIMNRPDAQNESDEKDTTSDYLVFEENVYTCPENVHSPAGDVFSFGVLMLETWLNKAQRSTTSTLSVLLEQAHSKFTQSRPKMLMPAIEYEFFHPELNQMVLDLVVTCTSRNSQDRPSMGDVLSDLIHMLESTPNMQGPPAYEPPTHDGHSDGELEEDNVWLNEKL